MRGGSARSLEETEGASPGAPVAHFSPQSKSVVNGVASRVKYTAAGKPGKFFRTKGRLFFTVTYLYSYAKLRNVKNHYSNR